MSEENVEKVRSTTNEWGQGNYSSVAWAHSEIELVGADGSVTRGINEAGKQWAEFLEAWDDFATLAEEILEAGDDRVLALVRFQGRGRGSGTPLADFSGAQLFTLREGKVVRLELFSQRDEALEAAGLSE
jgi:ketosteroid isomerase-like protein